MTSATDAHPPRHAAPAAGSGGQRAAAVAARATGRAEAGDTVEYVAHPPRAGQPATLPGPATWIPRRTDGGSARALRLGAVLAARAYRARRSQPAIARADVVHVHSNGLLAELAVLLARRAAQAGRPDAVRHRDLALRAEAVRPGSLHARVPRGVGRDVLQRAAARRARSELGLTRRRHADVVYPPVGARSSPGTTRPRRPTARAVARHQQPPPAGERQAAASAGRPALPDRGDERSDPHASRHAAGHLRHRPAARRAAGRRAIGWRRAARDVCRARGQCRRRPLLRGGRSLRPSVDSRGAADRRGRGAGLRHARSSRPTTLAGSSSTMSSAATCRSSPREQPLPLAQAIVAFLTSKRRTSAEHAGLDRTPDSVPAASPANIAPSTTT